ncbi:hypothetical protein [Floridanema aerugineum]|jgi:hypothetical protein|uniref:Uncharacterized protein n=1 Tax=Floridaenema aerugineum BLCC-F46 TaxID=3153654 RepID=A0ABV4WYA2_9CYAN
MTSTDPLLNSTLQHLRDLRQTLLRLHKALLDSERVEYEQFHGRIKSSNEFFQLVIGDEWFSWLRPISQFIVQIDEFLGSKEPVTLNEANQLLEQARVLIQPCAEGTLLEKQYFRAIQRDPDIALMNAEVTKMLAK